MERTLAEVLENMLSLKMTLKIKSLKHMRKSNSKKDNRSNNKNTNSLLKKFNQITQTDKNVLK